jgi:choline dehydrogenase-like flavoprotein
VNNGVCFDLPDEVLQRWNSPELDAGLSPERLARAFRETRQLINVIRQTGIRGNPIEARMPNAGFEAVEANLENCLGCGNCNIGCAFNRKLSMLTHVLPAAQHTTDKLRERDPGFHGRLEILPDCEVTSVVHRDGRATGVSCQLRLPDGGTRKLVVEADEVILAAGAIHSSRILMASGIGGDLVGKGLSANLGSHMTACWPENRPLTAYDGLQMSHFHDGGSPAYRIETWFNPVMSQALVMPGWLGHHERNMQRYNRLGCLGVIAGSSRNGNHVKRRRDFLSGAEIEFTPSTDDLKVLLGGLREAGRMLLDAGAECVMPATFAYREFRSADELARLEIGDLVTDASDISVNTGHPQGGNPISRDRRRGVVDETLRVHDFSNLRVCDASVFPTAITVNPQLTVMALAHYAMETF